MALTLRTSKGSKLSIAEMDENFTFLNNQATGSFVGTAPSASVAISASYALSASYAVSASYETTYEVSSSYADTAISASYSLTASLAYTASFVTTAQTASYVETARSASYVANSLSASNAAEAAVLGTTLFKNDASHYIYQSSSNASATYAAAFGNNTQAISGSTFAAGRNSLAGGIGAAAFNQATATGIDSFAIGAGSVAYLDGMYSHGSHATNQGQHGDVTLQCVTTSSNAAFTTMSIDAAASWIVVPNNTAYAFNGQIIATSASLFSSFRISGSCDNVAGTLTMRASGSLTEYNGLSLSTPAVKAIANDANNALEIHVSGSGKAGAVSENWTAYIEWTEISL